MTGDQQNSGQEKKEGRSGRILFLLPLFFFAALCVIFFMQLLGGRDTSEVPSALIGKPIPVFDLPALQASGKPGFSNRSAAEAKVTLINVWASWCVPCRAEHPLITRLADDPRLTVFGLNYKDKPDAALAFLSELGNPFDAIGADESGRVGIEFGVYGVPETFVVSHDGIIVYKFIGPLTESRLKNELMPSIEKALEKATVN